MNLGKQAIDRLKWPGKVEQGCATENRARLARQLARLGLTLFLDRCGLSSFESSSIPFLLLAAAPLTPLRRVLLYSQGYTGEVPGGWMEAMAL